jgi:catechol 2,3-dioxygenase-like lactoylglutathione lyase family enzyme
VTGSRQDLGLTHVALPIADAARSAAFYERFADMEVVHQRTDSQTGARVVWLSDLTRPFVVVLIESPVSHTLGGFSHLGVGCTSRAEVDTRVEAARAAGHQVLGPFDDGPPVGYWTIIGDPDGHNLELSYGQEVAFTVTRHEPDPPTTR